MISYLTVGVSDIERARAFYDALFGSIGGKRLLVLEDNGFTQYGTGWNKCSFVITRPFDGAPSHPGNGNMAALALESRAQVDAFYDKAIELGGRCEGKPGMREPAALNFYAAYVRDPDGNKLCVFAVG